MDTAGVKPICPYCNAELLKVPEKKTKCPHCGGFIYLRYSPSNPIKRLVTESEMKQIEVEWETKNAIDLIWNPFKNWGVDRHKIEVMFLNGVDAALIHKQIISEIIPTTGDFKHVGKLYMNIADELSPIIQDINDKEPELDEEGEEIFIDTLGMQENIYMATFNFYNDILRECLQITKYQKLDIENYRIDCVIDFRTSEFENALNGRIFPVKKAVDFYMSLLTCTTIAELKSIKPLRLNSEKFNFDINNLPDSLILPPFTLGCRACTNGVIE